MINNNIFYISLIVEYVVMSNYYQITYSVKLYINKLTQIHKQQKKRNHKIFFKIVNVL